MVTNVSQFLKEEVGATRRVLIDEGCLALDDALPLSAPIQGYADLLRTNRGILVRARIATAVRLNCSRCVESFDERLQIEFAEEYIPVVDVETGAPTNIPRESHTYVINGRHELDLAEAIREYGLLELPMKPLCEIDCKGLCPHCGTNLNLGRCRCVEDVRDGRFAVLKALLPSEIDNN